MFCQQDIKILLFLQYNSKKEYFVRVKIKVTLFHKGKIIFLFSI